MARGFERWPSLKWGAHLRHGNVAEKRRIATRRPRLFNENRLAVFYVGLAPDAMERACGIGLTTSLHVHQRANTRLARRARQGATERTISATPSAGGDAHARNHFARRHIKTDALPKCFRAQTDPSEPEGARGRSPDESPRKQGLDEMRVVGVCFEVGLRSTQLSARDQRVSQHKRSRSARF